MMTRYLPGFRFSESGRNRCGSESRLKYRPVGWSGVRARDARAQLSKSEAVEVHLRIAISGTRGFRTVCHCHASAKVFSFRPPSGERSVIQCEAMARPHLAAVAH